MKTKEIRNMSANDREKKMKELKLELVKSKSGNTKGSRTKGIKRMIARILTLNKLDEGRSSKEVGKNK